MDPMDHPADSGHNSDMNPGRASGDQKMKEQMALAQEISDSVPRTGNTTATNYSVQPGKSK